MIRDLIFLGIALPLFFFWGVPNLRVALTLLMPSKIRCEFEPDQDDIDAEDYLPQTQKLLDRLVELGFQPLGVKCEWRPGKRVRELAYACEQRKSFASIHSYDDDAPHYYFYTPFKDGAVVLTSDLPVNAVRTKAFVHSGAAGKTPSELFELHLKNVARMQKQGHEPCDAYNRQARLQATDAYYKNEGSKEMEHRLLLKTLGSAATSLGLLLLAALVLAWRFVRD